MAQPHELRSYEYVNHPYTAVRDALRADPAGIFQRATKGAAGRANAVAASLHVDLGGIDIGADVTIHVSGVSERTDGPKGYAPMTTLKLEWKAAHAAPLFPSMEAELRVYPLSHDETQLELHGQYKPPLGVLGNAVDSVVMHRVADASVHRFVADVAKLLADELG